MVQSNTRSLWLNALVACCCLPVLSGQVVAQPLFAHAESVESIAANSDIVVLGTVVDFGDAKLVDGFGRCPVTIWVTETLKGEHAPRLQVQLQVCCLFLDPGGVVKVARETHRYCARMWGQLARTSRYGRLCQVELRAGSPVEREDRSGTRPV